MKMNFILPSLFAGILALFVLSCSKNDSDGIGDKNSLYIIEVANDGTTRALVDNVCPLMEITDPLSADEIEFLYAIREDEKLSRDLFLAFSSQYTDVSQFSRFASAEATHIAAVERVLSYYEIEFPVLEEAGVFENADRQAYYDQCLAKGTSPTEAIKIMALVEEENVKAYMTVQPNIANPNIKMIVGNLLKSSSNHLRALVKQIQKTGISYMPTVLEQSIFDRIVNSEFNKGEKCCQHKCKHGKGGNTNSEKGGHHKGKKGSVDCNGTCNNTSNGDCPGKGNGKGQPGKGYRGGK